MSIWRHTLPALTLVAATQAAHGGGNLDIIDVTGLAPAPYPGLVLGTVKGMRWDDRCIPAAFRVNETLDPVPNVPGLPPVGLAESIAAIERAFASWNQIPTSYIEMRVEGRTRSEVAPGFDFVNEVSFRYPEFMNTGIAVSLSTALMADTQFVHGEDIDGDGDADVSSAILHCADADGDGDIELPAGAYRAGTIVDSDVAFNTAVRFSTDGSGLGSSEVWDLQSVMAHELGHAHGLAHSAVVQGSPRDGREATMYGGAVDAVGKLATRRLHDDDIAWSSFLYPEGSSAAGPGALQPGDLAFDSRYALIRGSVQHAGGRPAIGQLVFAEDLAGNMLTSGPNGQARVALAPATLGNIGTTYRLLPPALGVASTRYALPVPKGVYRVGIEPNDGTPEPSLATKLGSVGWWYGGYRFIEEYHDGATEGGAEASLGRARAVPATADRDGIDFVLDARQHIVNVNSYDGSAVSSRFGGVMLAKRVPREQVLALDRGRGISVLAATFFTLPQLTSDVAVYESALLAPGRIGADGLPTIDLAGALLRSAPFVGQDFDETPLYADDARQLGDRVRQILTTTDQELFLVLDLPPDTYPGLPEYLRLGVLTDVVTEGETDFGLSFFSPDNGATWQRDTGFEYGFGLAVAPR